MLKHARKGSRLLPKDRKWRAYHRTAAVFLSVAMLLNAIPALAITSHNTGEEYCTCGQLLHTHTDACYQESAVCGLEEQEAHTHDKDTCFTQLLDCGQEELHTHTEEECYDNVLVCEDTLHEHNEACYEFRFVCEKPEVFGHAHDESCLNHDPVCGLEEGVAHEHDSSCYTKSLTCGSDEIAAHAHNRGCYTSKLICEDTSEDHTHGSDCYEEALTCGQGETDGHQHEDACYTSDLTCDLEAGAIHSHDDSCYSTAYICGMKEGEGHTHRAHCYSKELTCELVEQDVDHVHDDTCWASRLACGKEEHQYTEGVCPAPEGMQKSLQTETGLPDIYVEDGYLYVDDTESYAIADFKSANGTVVTFVLANDEDVYDVLTGELPGDYSGAAELSIYMEFLHAQIQDFGSMCSVAFTGISLDEAFTDYVTDNDGNNVGFYHVDTDGTIYIMLDEDGQALDTLSFFHSFDVTVSRGEDVSLVGIDENPIGGDLIICKGDLRDESPLYGAQFALYEDANTSTLYQSGKTTTTFFGGATNETTFRGLQPGTYYLAETVAPEGYARDEQVYTITVGEDYSISTYPELETVDVNTTYSLDETAANSLGIQFYNSFVGWSELYIQVRDARTGKIIPGFEFTKYSDASLSDPVKGTIASDGSSYFGNWPMGKTYYIKETKTPQGYTPDTTLYAVTSEGGDTFTCSPTGLLPTSNAFEPTEDAVFSVGTVYSSRAADNLVFAVDKTLTDNFPAGEYEFSFLATYYDENAEETGSEVLTLTATVGKDGTYTLDTEPLISWYVDYDDTYDVKFGFTLEELQPDNTNVIIPDYWYEVWFEIYEGGRDYPLNARGSALMGPEVYISIDKCFPDGTKELLVWEREDAALASYYSYDLSFENDYKQDDNVVLTVDKTLTNNFPAGEYEFPFQLEYTLNGSSYTETQTVKATVLEDGSYTIDADALFGWYFNSNETDGNAVSFTLKELQPEDINVVIPDYWYKGTIVYEEDSEALSLSLDDGVAPTFYVGMLFSISVDKCFEDGFSSAFYSENEFSWNGALTEIAFPFENSYATPPTVTKQVKENDTWSDTEQWSDFTTADYGDTVQYKLTGTMPSNLESCDTCEYSISDTAYGLDVDSTSFVIKIDGKPVDSSDYSLSVERDASGTYTTLEFSDIKIVLNKIGVTSGSDAVVEVQYSAQYQGPSPISALSDDEQGVPGENTAYARVGSMLRSARAAANVYSFNVIVDKVDEYGEALSGALFELQKLNEETGGYEDYQAYTETGTSFAFDGLSAGSYRLIETMVPPDYEGMDPFDFTIVCGENFNIDKTDYDIIYDDSRSDVEMAFQFIESNGQGELTFTVANEEIEYLPEGLPNTGSLGTQLFYGTGAALLVCGAILVLKKRKGFSESDL